MKRFLRVVLAVMATVALVAGCRSVAELPPEWGKECPDPLTFDVPDGAKEVVLKKWRHWGAYGTTIECEYYVQGLKLGDRRYYKPDGFFKKRELTDQKLYYRGQLHGHFIETSGAGRRVEGFFKLGKRHGTIKEWMSDGRLDAVAEYRDGKRNGPTEYPIIHKTTTFKDDVKDGLEVWKTRGYMGFSHAVIIHYLYRNDKLNGTTKVFDGYGTEKLLLEQDYRDGKEVARRVIYPSGRVQSQTLYHDERPYLDTEYDEDGTVNSLQTIKEGRIHGVIIRWDKGGAVSSVRFSLDGETVSEAVYRQRMAGDPNLPQIGPALEREAFLRTLKWGPNLNKETP